MMLQPHRFNLGKIDVRNWQSSEPLLSTKEILTEETA
jgi:hypothetical protein